MSAPGALDSDSNQSLDSLIIQNLLTPTRIGKLLKYLPMIAYISIIVLLFPIILVVLKFSQTNVQWVMHNTISSSIEFSKITRHLKSLWLYHLTLPVFVLSLCAIIASIYKRDKRAIFFLLWIIGFYIQI